MRLDAEQFRQAINNKGYAKYSVIVRSEIDSATVWIENIADLIYLSYTPSVGAKTVTHWHLSSWQLA